MLDGVLISGKLMSLLCGGENSADTYLNFRSFFLDYECVLTECGKINHVFRLVRFNGALAFIYDWI